jgi:hypothetical protein
MTSTTSNTKTTTAIGIGAAGVAAAAAAAAGAYWLYGAKNSAQHRRMAKSWMLKARAEVMDAVEKMQEIDKTTYLAIVDNIMKRYAKLGITSQEMAQMMRDFKAAWVHVQAARNESQRGVTHAKKAGKTLTRKSSRSRSKSASTK